MTQSGAEITVVIPAWNAARWLERTLASVRRQSLQPAETLVVDDGSSDGTAAIAKSFGARVVRRPNGGVSAARNTGIAAARTPWVALLDHDDVWEPQKLELQWAALRAAPACRFSFTDVYLFDDAGVMDARSHWVRRKYAIVVKRPLGGTAYVYPKETFARDFARADYVLPSTMMLERSFALEAGGFDERLGWLEDREFVNRIVHRTDTAVVEEALTGYYHHAAMGSNWDARNARHEAAMVQIVAANPAAYLPSTVEQHAAEVPHALLRSGKALLAERSYRDAAAAFAASFSARPSAAAAAGVCAARAFRLPGVSRVAYTAYAVLKVSATLVRALSRRTREP